MSAMLTLSHLPLPHHCMLAVGSHGLVHHPSCCCERTSFRPSSVFSSKNYGLSRQKVILIVLQKQSSFCPSIKPLFYFVLQFYLFILRVLSVLPSVLHVSFMKDREGQKAKRTKPKDTRGTRTRQEEFVIQLR
jgi:predicted neutral ceramidase superfamily lipid hydrolase